ncbi:MULTISPECIES: TonB-dependent receptor domain-containing protein [unclassified Sphingobium]|uniref:TonB-dependent receptor domain-containing protein n=1 Tax=unclassified Sphingobium TaxID=2611147 RepID=UPI0015E6D144|nr:MULTISPECIES: TonB-dependent receptor [unclassified Sphingobium]MBG6116360.1 outer membrane receptor protein involved in Fe transport [Sphingobium sp. JAI105]
MKLHFQYASAIIALAVSMQCGIARAQEITSTTEAGSPAQPNEIVVTGSRISGNMNSKSPMVSIDGAQLQQTGSVTLDDVLNRLPQIVPSRGATSNGALLGGITTLDLRGLGSNRTLVLQDFHRLPAAISLGAVDINMIPSALIESVEVLTGGASAAYGSDAVAGVVNFKLNHKFTGLKLDAQTGITGRGDGFTAKLSATGGVEFADGRGHAILAASYDYRRGISNLSREFSRISRPSSALTTGTYVANGANLPSQNAVNSVFSGYGAAPGSVGASRNLGFNADGSLFSFQTDSFNFRDSGFGLITSGSGVRYNSAGVTGLTIPLKRYGLYGYTDFEISDAATIYAEGNYQHYSSTADYAPLSTTLFVPLSNPFVPEALKTILASRPNPAANFSVTRRFAEIGPRLQNSETDVYQVRLGAKGNVGIGDWTWEISGQYARNETDRSNLNGISASALATLVSAADGGRALCAGGLNLFGLQANSACADYIRRSTRESSVSKQGMVEANLQGSLLTLPAGPLKFALGADYRSDTFGYEPDNALKSGDIISFQSSALVPVNGNIKAKEVYAELSLPILHDLPLIRALDINLGYRYSDYQRLGGVSSYRAEASWELVRGLRARGGYARAVRVPSIQEAYAPTSRSSPTIGFAGTGGQGDPCDVGGAYRKGSSAASVRSLCVAQGVPAAIVDNYVFSTSQLIEGGTVGGNINLEPEVADTFTIGATFDPHIASPWFSRLTLSADYYNIAIKGAVGTLSATSIIQKCYNFDGSNASYSPSNYYCQLFDRNRSTGEIGGLQLNNLNLGNIKTSGIDIALDWLVDLDGANFPGGGKLQINGSVTRLESFKVQSLPGDAAIEYGGSIGYADATSVKALPRWKGLVSVSYSNGPATIGAQYRYVDRMLDASYVGGTSGTGEYTSAKSYVDLSLSMEVAKSFEYRMGVTNLTDTKPATFSSFDQSNTLPGVYDVFGTSFYAGVSIKW